jgi:hypothetical protein
MSESREQSNSFEQTYPKHPFSELVRLGVALGKWIARRDDQRARDEQQADPSVGSANRPLFPFLRS